MFQTTNQRICFYKYLQFPPCSPILRTLFLQAGCFKAVWAWKSCITSWLSKTRRTCNRLISHRSQNYGKGPQLVVFPTAILFCSFQFTTMPKSNASDPAIFGWAWATSQPSSAIHVRSFRHRPPVLTKGRFELLPFNLSRTILGHHGARF